MRVALTGGTGLVGGAVTDALRGDGHEVLHLVRPPWQSGPGQIAWDPAGGTIDAQGLEGIDAVINLAGEPLTALRWTAAKKRRIYSSRVDGTQLLARTLADLGQPPQALISQSATGYYGDRGNEVLTEDSPAGTGFLAEVATEWEQATTPAREKGIRVVHLRRSSRACCRPFGSASADPSAAVASGGHGSRSTTWSGSSGTSFKARTCTDR